MCLVQGGWCEALQARTSAHGFQGILSEATHVKQLAKAMRYMLREQGLPGKLAKVLKLNIPMSYSPPPQPPLSPLPHACKGQKRPTSPAWKEGLGKAKMWVSQQSTGPATKKPSSTHSACDLLFSQLQCPPICKMRNQKARGCAP